MVEYLLIYKIGGYWQTMIYWIIKGTDIIPEELAETLVRI